MKNTTNLLKALIREVLLLEEETAPATTAPAASETPATSTTGTSKKSKKFTKANSKAEKLMALKLKLARELGLRGKELRKSPTGKLLTQTLSQLLKKDKLKIDVEPDPTKAPASSKAPTPDDATKKTAADAAPASAGADPFARPSASETSDSTAAPTSSGAGAVKDLDLSRKIANLLLTNVATAATKENINKFIENADSYIRTLPSGGTNSRPLKNLFTFFDIQDADKGMFSEENLSKTNWKSVINQVVQKLKEEISNPRAETGNPKETPAEEKGDASKSGEAAKPESEKAPDGKKAGLGDISEQIIQKWNEIHKEGSVEKTIRPKWNPLKDLAGSFGEVKKPEDNWITLQVGDDIYPIPIHPSVESGTRTEGHYEIETIPGPGRPVMKKLASVRRPEFNLNRPAAGTVNKGILQIPEEFS
jgi:hypothetical protein